MVPAYKRAMEQAQTERVGKKSQYVGSIKERLEETLTLLKITPISGIFGTVDIHRFLDENDNLIVWFANSNSNMEEGETYRVKMTVKKHEEYKSIKQTTVTRVSIIK